MKIFQGKVVSKNMEKTATVVVERVVAHPIYKKRYKRSKKYHVHDEIGVEIGQTIKFVASKPHSKTKKWKVIGRIDTTTAGRQRFTVKKKVRKVKVSRRKTKSE